MLAECPNQEGCHMSLEVFEKTQLPGDTDKALTLIYKDKPKTRIEVWVKEGFAVAEVKLHHCKEDTENEDWEKVANKIKKLSFSANKDLQIELIDRIN